MLLLLGAALASVATAVLEITNFDSDNCSGSPTGSISFVRGCLRFPADLVVAPFGESDFIAAPSMMVEVGVDARDGCPGVDLFSNFPCGTCIRDENFGSVRVEEQCSPLGGTADYHLGNDWTLMRYSSPTCSGEPTESFALEYGCTRFDDYFLSATVSIENGGTMNFEVTRGSCTGPSQSTASLRCGVCQQIDGGSEIVQCPTELPGGGRVALPAFNPDDDPPSDGDDDDDDDDDDNGPSAASAAAPGFLAILLAAAVLA